MPPLSPRQLCYNGFQHIRKGFVMVWGKEWAVGVWVISSLLSSIVYFENRFRRLSFGRWCKRQNSNSGISVQRCSWVFAILCRIRPSNLFPCCARSIWGGYGRFRRRLGRNIRDGVSFRGRVTEKESFDEVPFAFVSTGLFRRCRRSFWEGTEGRLYCPRWLYHGCELEGRLKDVASSRIVFHVLLFYPGILRILDQRLVLVINFVFKSRFNPETTITLRGRGLGASGVHPLKAAAK